MRKLSPKQKAQHLRVCVTWEAYKQVIQPMDLKEKYCDHTAPQMIAAQLKYYISKVTVSVNKGYLNKVPQGSMTENQYAQSLMRAGMIAMPNKPGQDVAQMREESVMNSFLTGINSSEGRIVLWLGRHRSLAEMMAALDMYHMLRQDRRATIPTRRNLLVSCRIL